MPTVPSGFLHFSSEHGVGHRHFCGPPIPSLLQVTTRTAVRRKGLLAADNEAFRDRRLSHLPGKGLKLTSDLGYSAVSSRLFTAPYRTIAKTSLRKTVKHLRSQQGLLVHSQPAGENGRRTTVPKNAPLTPDFPSFPGGGPAGCSATTVSLDLSSPRPAGKGYLLSSLLGQGFCFQILQTEDLTDSSLSPESLHPPCLPIWLSFRRDTPLVPPWVVEGGQFRRRTDALVRAEVRGEHGRMPSPGIPLILGLPKANVRDGMKRR
ncbi:uncharacterized protein LOC144229241 [Crocuta crocuta]